MSLGPLGPLRDDETATLARIAAQTPDTALAARYGAPWAATLTARELERARQHGDSK